jgi:hypothetical protein
LTVHSLSVPGRSILQTQRFEYLEHIWILSTVPCESIWAFGFQLSISTVSSRSMTEYCHFANTVEFCYQLNVPLAESILFYVEKSLLNLLISLLTSLSIRIRRRLEWLQNDHRRGKIFQHSNHDKRSLAIVERFMTQ